MIERYRERHGYLPQTLTADTTYDNGELLQWLDDRGIAGYMRVKENGNGQSDDLYCIDQFTYVPRSCFWTKDPQERGRSDTFLPQIKHSTRELTIANCGKQLPMPIVI